MSLAHRLSPPSTPTPAPAGVPLLRGILGFAAVCALATAGAAVPLQWNQPGEASPLADAARHVLPAPVRVAARVLPRLRCGGCGVVESIRVIDATALIPASYEFTVRLRDGSVRTSSDASASLWRVGDQMTLIGPGQP